MKNKILWSVLILLIIVAGYLVYKNKITDTSNWKTYINTEYNFQFKYPRELYISDPLVLVEEGRFHNKSAQQIKLNSDLSKKDIDLFVDITKFDPLFLTVEEYCQKNGYPANDCFPVPITKNDVLVNKREINESKIGDIYEDERNYREIVRIDDQKGRLEISFSPSAGFYYARLKVYLSNNDLVEISMPLDDYDFTKFNQVKILNMAKESLKVKALRQIISNFKLLN